eukprot:1161298-Pelagomonas_calceolata.AAC.9
MAAVEVREEAGSRGRGGLQLRALLLLLLAKQDVIAHATVLCITRESGPCRWSPCWHPCCDSCQHPMCCHSLHLAKLWCQSARVAAGLAAASGADGLCADAWHQLLQNVLQLHDGLAPGHLCCPHPSAIHPPSRHPESARCLPGIAHRRCLPAGHHDVRAACMVPNVRANKRVRSGSLSPPHTPGGRCSFRACSPFCLHHSMFVHHAAPGHQNYYECICFQLHSNLGLYRGTYGQYKPISQNLGLCLAGVMLLLASSSLSYCGEPDVRGKQGVTEIASGQLELHLAWSGTPNAIRRARPNGPAHDWRPLWHLPILTLQNRGLAVVIHSHQHQTATNLFFFKF